MLTTTNPGGGPSTWTFANLLPYPQLDEKDEVETNGMFGVSCASATLCAIVGNRGQLFTSTDPFSAPPRAVPDGRKDQQNKKREPRPRTKIAAHPLPGVEIGGQKTKVRFRFFADGHAFVRGFACKLDKRPLKRCSSPKTYRVGLGKHVFRVRAIGFTGLKGPAAVARFKVCHPTKRGWCIGAFPR